MDEMRNPSPKSDPPVAIAALVPTFIVHLPKMAADRPPAAIWNENGRMFSLCSLMSKLYFEQSDFVKRFVKR